MEYQVDRTIEYEIQRNLMTCAPYRDDFLFSKKVLHIRSLFTRSFSHSIISRSRFDNNAPDRCYFPHSVSLMMMINQITSSFF